LQTRRPVPRLDDFDSLPLKVEAVQHAKGRLIIDD
jgi:hypothetical protein